MNILKGNQKRILIVVVIVLIFVVVGIGIWQYFKDFRKGPPQKTGCDWRPTRDYGLCERILGVYYNGQRCVWLSGCSLGSDKAPFKLLEDCESPCKK